MSHIRIATPINRLLFGGQQRRRLMLTSSSSSCHKLSSFKANGSLVLSNNNNNLSGRKFIRVHEEATQQVSVGSSNKIRSFSTCSRLFQQQSNTSHTKRDEFNTLLLTNVDKHVVHLEFNRPKVKNAFSVETGTEFIKALKLLEEDTSVRCVIISGVGPDFTSGVDLKSFMGIYSQLQETEDAARKAKLLRNIIEQFQQPFKEMHLFTKPIICVQHGLSYGLAMELAACSDIRYCSRDTKLSIREVLIGIAADVGSLQELPRLFSNQSLLRELIYTGRDLTMDEALQTGFVSKVLESKEQALEEGLKTAKIISSRSPVAVQGSKQNLLFSRDKPFHVGLDYNAIWNMSMLQSEDVVKAVTAIMTKATEDTDYDNY